MEKNFTIREANVEDVDLLYEFIKEFAAFEKMSDLVHATPEKLKKSIFEEGHAQVIIGMEGEVPVGFALYFFNYSTFEGRPGLYLEDLYIREAYRGRGYGIAMMDKLAEIALAKDCKRFEWVCLDWNKPAIELYESLGAKAKEEWIIFRLDGDELIKMGQKE